MLKVAAVLFALAAIAGLTMATFFLLDKQFPSAVIAGHGVLAAAGLIAFIVAAVKRSVAGLAGISLGLFILAAIGGFIMLALDLAGKPLPFLFVVVHGVVAVVAFILLLIHVFLEKSGAPNA